MPYLYRPKGRAGEYAQWALNIYKGCAHGCRYCYVPRILRITPQEFRSNISCRIDFQKLRKELETHAQKGDIKGNILLCFSTDPYQPIEKELRCTERVIKMLREFGFRFTVLTKSTLATRDFRLYRNGDEFATTLTFFDDTKRKFWEPFASPTHERIEALREAKRLGIYTWVSLEPVIEPSETLTLIDVTHEFVDEYRIGVINYSPLKQKIDWRDFCSKLKGKLKQYGVAYLIKKDLQPFCEPPYSFRSSLYRDV